MRKNRILSLLVLLGALGFTAAPAHADALLFFSPSGVDSQLYGGPTSPVPVGSDGFRLTFHGGGSKSLLDPVLLILGVARNGGPTTAPVLTFGAMDNSFTASSLTLGGTNVYGGAWNTTTGFAGTFSSATDSQVYRFIGLNEAGSESQNYTNWSGQGGGATSWDIYVYSMTFKPDLQASDPDWVEFSGSLPGNTFAIAYGCKKLYTDGSGRCDFNQSTPFTRSGFTEATSVPEPTSLLLLGAGLAAMGLFRRLPK